MRAAWMPSLLFAFHHILSSSSIFAQPQNFHTLPTAWTNDESSITSTNFSDGSRIRVIPLNTADNPDFSCAFFCNGTCTSYLFSIVINSYYITCNILERCRMRVPAAGVPAVVVWSANRDYPVREGATLNLTAASGLVLQDVDGSVVWTTNTAGKSVAGMNLNHNGNLVLFDVHNSTVWESFNHPTDCLVAGQKLFPGQKLTPSVSSTNWTTQKDLYSLQLTNEGLFAYVQSNPPQLYYNYQYVRPPTYVQFINGSLSYFYHETEVDFLDTYSHEILPAYPIATYDYIKLMPDGQLKAFRDSKEGDLLSGPPGECGYPFACGRNAICSTDKQCSCPAGTDYFRAVDDRQPNEGCSPVTSLTCNDTQHQDFIELKNVEYYSDNITNTELMSVETCKQACLKNCSCKAAVFEYGLNSNSSGNCSLLYKLFTTTIDEEEITDSDVSTFVKIQKRRSISLSKAKIIGYAIGSFVLLLIVVIGVTMFIIQKKKMNSESEEEEEYLDQVPGMPTRFPYIQLKTATENFSKKLGEGGFGSVFEGTLEDGSRIAVKCLNKGLAQVKKSFLAEVVSIGSIHHVNLVRLRGFSAWKLERLLVYEFMSNGSLDRWIYSGDRNGKHILGWECRKKIIHDIAKGLAYLHEDCNQKIIHLDIKPQNILLDNNFNAKVSDFGLSKLIDRDQSQVMTTMRGTPGYMAPEWLSSVINEKVDVYSFGVVLLEILCGRKNFDTSQPEERWRLLCVFQRSWERETLLDIVDKYCEDMHVHGTEVIEMMKLASWCLQTESTKRPLMSSVVKVLEGATNVESNLDYNFLYPKLQKITYEYEKSSTSMLPSILSALR